MEHWNEIETTINKRMEKYHTHTILCKLIILAATQWRNTLHPARPDFVPGCMHNLFEAQSNIGWQQFSRGRVSHLWIQHCDIIAKMNKWKLKGSCWMSHIVSTIWKGILKVWNRAMNFNTER